ncbi:CxC2 domain-containing protein [Favolaschia claudopus]|uniref:CxC2 domain-containing protein n=1 Tax=Favolaschia claudopus TaxID=2862362 RepID=A0AAW0DCM3_9AGAR
MELLPHANLESERDGATEAGESDALEGGTGFDLAVALRSSLRTPSVPGHVLLREFIRWTSGSTRARFFGGGVGAGVVLGRVEAALLQAVAICAAAVARHSESSCGERSGLRSRASPCRRLAELSATRRPHQRIHFHELSDFATVPADQPIETVVERPSADGRRVRSEIIPIAPSSPVKHARVQQHQQQASPGELYDMELGGFFAPAPPAPRKTKNLTPSNKLLLEFLPLRDEYLREFLRLDGCGDASEDLCPGCGVSPPAFDASTATAGCCIAAECCVRNHADNPLHIVEEWDGCFFQRTTLKTLGLTIWFGHPDCSRRHSGHQNFVVLDVSGIHQVRVEFCAWVLCARKLLRRRWFPATDDHPRSAATFRLLDHFQKLTLQAKTTHWDFYCTVERMVDARGDVPPNRYRGGRGHATGGVGATSAGELAIRSALRDPGLGTGWSYFVEPEPYRKYLLTVTKQEETYANTKSRRPTGVGDLQKGERWFRMTLPSSARPPQLILYLCAYVIPKMHIHAHTMACQAPVFSHFLAGAGQTDGEGIERPWANLGGVAFQHPRMGPGSRADVLDDHFAFWNWCKLVSLGALLRKRLDRAKREREIQQESFKLKRVPEWEKQVCDWERAPKEFKNPYEIKTTGRRSLLRLAEEEAACLSRGVLALHDLGFRKLQATYTPGALQALARRDPNPEEVPEHTPLMLPSALSSAERDAGCIGSVQQVENFARDAQCSEALMRLRNQLHIKSRFFTYKELHILLHSAKYQAAWAALRELNQGAKQGWRKLRREDVRTMEDPEELTKKEALRRKQAERRKEKMKRLRKEGEYLASESEDEEGADAGEVEGDGEADDPMVGTRAENRREVSWIWTSAGSTGTDAELEDALRIEWTKARARARRWEEEVQLLEEEYRRVLISFEHEASGWEERAKQIPHAALYRTLAAKVTISMTEVQLWAWAECVPAAGGNAGDEGSDEESGDESGDDEDEGGAAAGHVHDDEECFF